MKTSVGRRRLRIWVPWTAVFGANLVLLLPIGWAFTAEGGRGGMFAALGMFWLLGYICCLRARAAARVLGIGGAVVALTQFYPYLQFFAGLVSLSIAQQLGVIGAGFASFEGVESPTEHADELGGFLVTTFTGGLLLAVAVAVGLFGRWVIGPLIARPATDGVNEASGIRPAR